MFLTACSLVAAIYSQWELTEMLNWNHTRGCMLLLPWCVLCWSRLIRAQSTVGMMESHGFAWSCMLPLGRPVAIGTGRSKHLSACA